MTTGWDMRTGAIGDGIEVPAVRGCCPLWVIVCVIGDDMRFGASSVFAVAVGEGRFEGRGNLCDSISGPYGPFDTGAGIQDVAVSWLGVSRSAIHTALALICRRGPRLELFAQCSTLRDGVSGEAFGERTLSVGRYALREGNTVAISRIRARLWIGGGVLARVVAGYMLTAAVLVYLAILSEDGKGHGLRRRRRPNGVQK